MNKLNIIISHTDTFVARMIRLFTKSYYNHCSIALDGDFIIAKVTNNTLRFIINIYLI